MTAECWICDDLGCSECMPDALEVGPDLLRYDQALAEVADGESPIAAKVLCARCHDWQELGTVRRHPTWGLFYEARLLHGVERTAHLLGVEAHLKGKARRNIPPVAVAVCRHLLAFPEVITAPSGGARRQDPPRAECPTCGIDSVSVSDLKAAAGGKRPGSTTIHRS